MDISEKIINSKAADSVLSTSAKDDFRQAFAVCNNELIKHIRSKKVVIYSVISVALVALIVCLNLFMGDDPMSDRMFNAGSGVINIGNIILIVMATMFSASAIVSEYEERTALILLTKPIKKTSILTGKYMASIVVGFITMVIVYIVGVSLMIAGKSELDFRFGLSFLVSILLIMMVSAIAMLVSSFAKKSSTAALLMLFVFLILSSTIEGILQSQGIETWWMLTSLSSAVHGALDPGYEIGRAVIMMVVWTVIGLVGAQKVFKRRQF